MHADGLVTLDPEKIRTLRNGLRIMALRALGDVDAAEDVVQESLLRAMNSVTAEIASDTPRLGAFVGGIARHVIADTRRRAARLATAEPQVAAAADDALTLVVRTEEQSQVRTAIERLTATDQMVVRASFYEGLTPTEIAGRLNEPVERIRKRKSRALARLRAMLMSTNGHGAVGSASIKQ